MKRNKRYEVFIASTLVDLAEAREVAVRCVLNSGNIPISLECFSPDIRRPQDIISSAIQHAEIFVLIIGSRLGSEISEKGQSYIDYEYEYAIKLNKPIIVFMLSEERVQEELSKVEYDRRNEIWKFRDKIKSERFVTYFSNMQELSVKFNGALQNIIEQQNIVPIGNSTIELYLETECSIENIISKLQALNSIYLQLCNLIGSSAIDYPLTIQNLETGSLWIKVFGESKVISMCVKLISSFILYIYKNHTVEGKIEQTPIKLEILYKILELSKKLDEVGVDTKELNNSINDSTLVIAKDLNKLLSGTSNLAINTETKMIGKVKEEKKRDATLLDSDQ